MDTDDKALLAYFRKHPNIGYVPERRQIGQLVAARKGQAEKMR